MGGNRSRRKLSFSFLRKLERPDFSPNFGRHSSLFRSGIRADDPIPLREICLPRDRCRDGPHLDFCAAGILRHVKQELTATQINGSRPFSYAKDSLLAETGDRFVLKSQLTPGLDSGLDRRALANIIAYCRRTR